MTNLLQQFYRTVKIYVTLPSGSGHYGEDVIEMNEDGEVGILPMTGKDEIGLKNPDGLLNGEAMRGLMKSCVVGLKDPDRLLINDVDAIMVAIKLASYGEGQTLTTECPKCQAENRYEVNFRQILDEMEALPQDSSVVLSSGATVFVKPFTFKEKMIAAKKAFEQTRVARQLQNASEDEQIKVISKSINEMAEMNYQLLANCVTKIIHEEHDLVFINSHETKNDVKEFLTNIPRKDAAAIDNEIDKINKIGVGKKFSLICEKCNHAWETELAYDNADFFTES